MFNGCQQWEFHFSIAGIGVFRVLTRLRVALMLRGVALSRFEKFPELAHVASVNK